MIKDQILAPSSGFKLTDWEIKRFIGEPPPYSWLVGNTFPSEAVSILAAMGDSGKGMLSAHLGLCVAQGPTGSVIDQYPKAFGNDVLAHGTAVIFTAEDDNDEVHRRLYQIDPNGAWRKYKYTPIVVPLPNAGGPRPLVKSYIYL